MTSLHLYLSYRDASAALSWLERAFGFETTMRYPDSGRVAHAEARLGAAAIIIFSDDGYSRLDQHGDTVGYGAYLAVADEAAVDAVWSRALEVGATPVWKPEPTEWGNYRCRVLDPEGYEWTFGTHKPGEPAGDW